MYEIIATEEQREQFKKVARAKMAMQGIGVKGLAKELAYSPKTIYRFFSKGKWSRFISAYLARKLEIREEEWR